MKKNILFLFLFIIGASCSMAQDTIYDSQMDGPYLMPTNHFPHLLVVDCDIPQWKHQKGEFIGQYHTDTSITVYGIAFTAFLKAYHLFPLTVIATIVDASTYIVFVASSVFDEHVVAVLAFSGFKHHTLVVG